MPRIATKKPAKPPKQVYMVEDVGHAPGRVYSVFDDIENANDFAEALEDTVTFVSVVARTLFYGQPPNRGYNE